MTVEATESGALRDKALSATAQVVALMARLTRHQDLANATPHRRDPAAMQGPLLADVKFPDVLVAKTYNYDGRSLDLVLYPRKKAGVFKLGFERSVPGVRYQIGNARLSANKSSVKSVEVGIDGRTQLILSPVVDCV